MTKRIAIYNSYYFHYEMFGYIIFYCYLNKYKLDIFTENKQNIGWILFYEELIKHINANIDFFYYEEFNNDLVRNNYDLIFLTTDDDPKFKCEWMNKKVICINHYYKYRRINCFHCLAIAPFYKNKIKWGLPCYPRINKLNKYIDPINMNVAIVGGGYFNHNLYNINIINRLKSNKKIILHIFTCIITEEMIKILHKKNNENIEIILYKRIETKSMFSLLQKVNYMLINSTINEDHNTGKTISGSVSLAFTTLSRLIISNNINKIYNFSSALEFDMDTDEDIFLHDTVEETHDLIIDERDTLIQMFHHNVDEIIKMNETMNDNELYNYLSKTQINL